MCIFLSFLNFRSKSATFFLIFCPCFLSNFSNFQIYCNYLSAHLPTNICPKIQNVYSYYFTVKYIQFTKYFSLHNPLNIFWKIQCHCNGWFLLTPFCNNCPSLCLQLPQLVGILISVAIICSSQNKILFLLFHLFSQFHNIKYFIHSSKDHFVCSATIVKFN